MRYLRSETGQNSPYRAPVTEGREVKVDVENPFPDLERHCRVEKEPTSASQDGKMAIYIPYQLGCFSNQQNSIASNLGFVVRPTFTSTKSGETRSVGLWSGLAMQLQSWRNSGNGAVAAWLVGQSISERTLEATRSNHGSRGLLSVSPFPVNIRQPPQSGCVWSFRPSW